MARRTTVEAKVTNISADAESSPVIPKSPPLSAHPNNAMGSSGSTERVEDSLKTQQDTYIPSTSLSPDVDTNPNRAEEAIALNTGRRGLRSSDALADTHENVSSVTKSENKPNDQSRSTGKLQRPTKGKNTKQKAPPKARKSRASKTHKEGTPAGSEASINVGNNVGISSGDRSVAHPVVQLPVSNGTGIPSARAAKVHAMAALTQHHDSRRASLAASDISSHRSNADNDALPLDGSANNKFTLRDGDTNKNIPVPDLQQDCLPTIDVNRKPEQDYQTHSSTVHKLANHKRTGVERRNSETENAVRNSDTNVDTTLRSAIGHTRSDAIILSDHESSSEDEQSTTLRRPKQPGAPIWQTAPEDFRSNDGDYDERMFINHANLTQQFQEIEQAKYSAGQSNGEIDEKVTIYEPIVPETMSETAMPPPKRRRVAPSTIIGQGPNPNSMQTVVHQRNLISLKMPLPVSIPPSNASRGELPTYSGTLNHPRHFASEQELPLGTIRSDRRLNTMEGNARQDAAANPGPLNVSSFGEPVEEHLRAGAEQQQQQQQQSHRKSAGASISRTHQNLSPISRVKVKIKELHAAYSEQAAYVQNELKDCMLILEESGSYYADMRRDIVREMTTALRGNLDNFEAMNTQLL